MAFFEKKQVEKPQISLEARFAANKLEAEMYQHEIEQNPIYIKQNVQANENPVGDYFLQGELSEPLMSSASKIIVEGVESIEAFQSKKDQESYFIEMAMQEENVVSRVRELMKTQFGERIIAEKQKNTFQRDIKFAIEEALKNEGKFVPTVEDRQRLLERIYNLIIGYGPLELLFNQGYSEIMVSRFDRIFVEDKGKMILSDVKFSNENELRSIIEQIVSPIGRVINESSPIVDARLPDGSRVNAVISPIAVDGAQLTIRRFPEKKMVFEDYIKYESLNQKVLDFLKIAVESQWNLIVSGGTGSGKTSLLNLMGNFLDYDPGLAVMTIEDSCELRISHPNVRRYETRPANSSGTGEVTSRSLVKNVMRSRPDVVVIGEIRDGTMADFLRMATSGHDGCMTTVHCDSPEELGNTIQVLFQMAEDYNFSESAIRRLYAAGVDLIIQIKRCSDYVRRITHVSHVVGYGKIGARKLNIALNSPEYDPDEVYIRDIFVWRQKGIRDDGKFNGEYVPTGYIPEGLIKKAKDHKVIIDLDIFKVDN